MDFSSLSQSHQETDAAVATAAEAATIGVFDSGVGGFTVAGAILRQRPDLGLVYFGDNLNMPYGGRAPDQIARFAQHSIEFLLRQGIDILAVGCNASNSVLGQGELKSYGVPAYDLVSSTIMHLKELEEPPQRLALVATQAAVNSRYWQRKLTEVFPQLEITAVAAPDFVPLTEALQRDEAAIRTAVRRYLQPVLDSGVTLIIHGCTHYPLLEDYMRELSPQLRFIDPAHCLARRLCDSLPPPAEDAPPGRLRCFSSLPGETFYRTGERLLGRPVRPYTTMYIVNPYED